MTEKHIDPNLKNEADEDMDDELSSVITLEMEDGSEKDFVALETLQHEGVNYIALSEVNSMDYDVLRFVEMDEVMELSIIEDDDEYELITDLFRAKLEAMYLEGEEDEEFEEDDDDEDDEEDEVEKELTS